MCDYQIKAHTTNVHKQGSHYYVQTMNSSRELPRATTPSSRQGCVEIQGGLYYIEPYSPVFQSIVTLVGKSKLSKPTVWITGVEPKCPCRLSQRIPKETLNSPHQQLRSLALNPLSLPVITMDINIYVDVGTRPAHHECTPTACTCDSHRVDTGMLVI